MRSRQLFAAVDRILFKSDDMQQEAIEVCELLATTRTTSRLTSISDGSNEQVQYREGEGISSKLDRRPRVDQLLRTLLNLSRKRYVTMQQGLMDDKLTLFSLTRGKVRHGTA